MTTHWSILLMLATAGTQIPTRLVLSTYRINVVAPRRELTLTVSAAFYLSITYIYISFCTPAPTRSVSGQQDPIVIIGSSCRFAGSITPPAELWKLLQESRDVQTLIHDSRFNTK
jgi:hypothetical protein